MAGDRSLIWPDLVKVWGVVVGVGGWGVAAH
jgi:hypothetical protein